jgi:ankyrin repeat protein
VNAKNAKGETPLAIAETKGHVDIAKLLKKHGAKK